MINKIIAERLSDKIQVMMVPSDGKFFFANDVFRGFNASPAMQQEMGGDDDAKAWCSGRRALSAVVGWGCVHGGPSLNLMGRREAMITARYNLRDPMNDARRLTMRLLSVCGLCLRARRGARRWIAGRRRPRNWLGRLRR